jgi:hypothetical protein
MVITNPGNGNIPLEAEAGEPGEEINLPVNYSLGQNYPNPSNPSTTFRFALPGGGNVSLTVYDLLGREVALLARGHLEAGYHTATWNATDNSGLPIASGIYFARFIVTDALGQVKFSEVNKLALIR